MERSGVVLGGFEDEFNSEKQESFLILPRYVGYPFNEKFSCKFSRKLIEHWVRTESDRNADCIVDRKKVLG